MSEKIIGREKKPRVHWLEIMNFLLFSVGVLGIWHYLAPLSLRAWILLPYALSCAYLFWRKSVLAYPSLYFFILYLAIVVIGTLPQWLIFMFIALALWSLPALFIPSLRKEFDWLRWGKIDWVSVGLALGTLVLSSVALIVWAQVFKHHMTDYVRYIPNWNRWQLIIGIGAFALFNAIGEEAVFRGIFQGALDRIWSHKIAGLLIQALFFGLCHYKGFPGGEVGIILALIYGLMLGILKNRTGGLLLPILTHIFADTTIALIVLKYFQRV